MDIPYTLIEVPVYSKYSALAVLVENVVNQEFIKENLIKGNTDYDYAFINAGNIITLEQIYSAFYKAMMDDDHGNMKSRTLHTEFIYALAPFKNIMDCLNKFGISKTSNSLVILKIREKVIFTDEFISSELQNIKNIVDGDICQLSDDNLQKTLDMKAIEKNYRIKIKGTELENNYLAVSRSLISITQLKGI